MPRSSSHPRPAMVAVATALILAGCSRSLIKDEATSTPTTAVHCEGSEIVDRSMVAEVPVPFLAFFVRLVDVNETKAQEYVNRCGNRRNLVNREVKISRTACVPAALTRFITLGVWQWCPAEVSWEADVIEGSSAGDAWRQDREDY